MLDFTIQKMNHNLWKRKLSKHLNQDEPINEKEMVSERDCELGKWLYATGLDKFSHISEIQTLEKTHATLHQLTHKIVNLKKMDQKTEAFEKLKELENISEKIIQLLDTLELKIKKAES